MQEMKIKIHPKTFKKIKTKPQGSNILVITK